MANLVNKIMLEGLEAEFRDMGSCVVVSFDKLDVARDEAVRTKLREAGLHLRVVKNRLAVRAFRSMDLEMGEAFTGKCAVVVAPEEQAIAAARLLRDTLGPRKPQPLVVTGAVIEGQVIVGPAARGVADMPDRPAASYIEWLAGDPGSSPQPYEHLARRFHEAGEPYKSNEVLYAARERQRRKAW